MTGSQGSRGMAASRSIAAPGRGTALGWPVDPEVVPAGLRIAAMFFSAARGSASRSLYDTARPCQIRAGFSGCGRATVAIRSASGRAMRESSTFLFDELTAAHSGWARWRWPASQAMRSGPRDESFGRGGRARRSPALSG